MIEAGSPISSTGPNINITAQQNSNPKVAKSNFSDTVKAVEKYISSVDETQKTADTSVKDLITGKNTDITTVVSEIAKADMSFKLLVGVRNKLIEAYKQTMSMPL